MKKETRTKTVEYDVYVAKDGKVFNSENECIHYEKILDGIRKVCPECKGKGYFLVEEMDENYHTGAPETRIVEKTCENCNGKGYLEKKEVWK